MSVVSKRKSGGNFDFVDKGPSMDLPPMKAKKRPFWKKLLGMK